MRFTLFVRLMLVIAFIATLAAPVMASQNEQLVAPILVVNTSFLNVRTGPSANFGVLTTVVGGTELPVLGTAGDGVWYQVSTAVGIGWVNVEFTLPRGDFTNVPLVSVNAIPSSATIIQRVPSNAVNVVPVVPSEVQAEAATSESTTHNGFSGVRLGITFVNPSAAVHVAPDINSGKITTIYDGEGVYIVVGQTFAQGVGWFLIDVPGIGTGWVDSEKVSLSFARTVDQSVVVTLGSIAFGSTPGGGGNGIVLPQGTEGLVRNISPDGQFVQIQLTDGRIGWVPFSSVTARTGTPTDETPLEPLPAPAPTTNEPVITAPSVNSANLAALGQGGGGTTIVAPIPVINTPRVVVNTSFLNIRSGPGAQYTVLFTARGASEYPVLGIASDGVWFLIQTPFGQGWVNNEFVLFRGSIEVVPIIENASGVIATPVVVVGSSAQLYAAPGVNFGVLGTIAGPVEAPIVARTPEFDWVQINTSAGFGWVLTSDVTVRGDVSLIPIVGN